MNLVKILTIVTITWNYPVLERMTAENIVLHLLAFLTGDKG